MYIKCDTPCYVLARNSPTIYTCYAYGVLDKMDADEDGFVTIGEVRAILKRYGKDAKSSLKPSILRRE